MKQRRGLSEFWSTDTKSKDDFFFENWWTKHKVLAPSGRQCIASVIKVKGDRKNAVPVWHLKSLHGSMTYQGVIWKFVERFQLI
jgi:hypothetical protein